MVAAKDLAEQRFGRLVAKRPVSTPRGRRWECICDCGATTFVRTPNLTTGWTRSCGCLWKDAVPGCTKRHGMTDTDIYRIWTLMIQRCHNPKARAFHNYGARGIVVCDRWRESFVAFAADVGERPSPAHSIDRIDNDGPYSPDNCRWATKKEQGNNSRKNHKLTLDGVTRSISQWAGQTGISQRTILTRIAQLGWPVDRALTTPPRQMNKRQTN